MTGLTSLRQNERLQWDGVAASSASQPPSGLTVIHAHQDPVRARWQATCKRNDVLVQSEIPRRPEGSREPPAGRRTVVLRGKHTVRSHQMHEHDVIVTQCAAGLPGERHAQLVPGACQVVAEQNWPAFESLAHLLS